VNDVLVRFYIDGQSIGEQLVDSLPASSSANVNLAWDSSGTPGGIYNIDAIVDPENVISESHENNNVVFITEAKLKTMLEEDFLALENSSDFATNGPKMNKVASLVMKEVILPKIQQDINQGKNFATLRQIYHSLILSVWFKQKFKDSFYKHYIEQGKIKGIDLSDKDAKDKIYNLHPNINVMRSVGK